MYQTREGCLALNMNFGGTIQAVTGYETFILFSSDVTAKNNILSKDGILKKALK